MGVVLQRQAEMLAVDRRVEGGVEVVTDPDLQRHALTLVYEKALGEFAAQQRHDVIDLFSSGGHLGNCPGQYLRCPETQKRRPYARRELRAAYPSRGF